VGEFAKVGTAQREGSGERIARGLWLFVVAVGSSGDVSGGKQGVFCCGSVCGCGVLVGGAIAAGGR